MEVFIMSRSVLDSLSLSCEASGYRSFGRAALVDGHPVRQEYCLKPWYLDRDCDVLHYHKLSFIHTYRKLRSGLNKAEWADNDNPSGIPTSEEYDKALQCYLSLYTFDNTSEPFYYRVLTGQYGKRSHKAYHAIATYLERKG